MPDTEAAGAAREASIGQQRDRLAEGHAFEHRGQRKHFAHPGAAARSFLPDDQYVARPDGATAYGFRRRLFAVKAARRAAEGHLVLVDSANLNHGALRGKIAEEGAETTAGAMGVSDGPDTLRMVVAHAFQVFPQRL